MSPRSTEARLAGALKKVKLLEAELSHRNEEISKLKKRMKELEGASKGASKALDLIPQVLRPGDSELKAAHREREADEKAKRCTFDFVSATWLKKYRGTTPPSMQEIQREQGALETRAVSMIEACRLKLRRTTLAVSHRWESPEEPDAGGHQVGAAELPPTSR